MARGERDQETGYFQAVHVLGDSCQEGERSHRGKGDQRTDQREEEEGEDAKGQREEGDARREEVASDFLSQLDEEEEDRLEEGGHLEDQPLAIQERGEEQTMQQEVDLRERVKENAV